MRRKYSGRNELLFLPIKSNKILNKNALEFKDRHHQALEAIINKHYVNNYLEIVDNEEKTIFLKKKIVMLSKVGSFQLYTNMCMGNQF